MRIRIEKLEEEHQLKHEAITNQIIAKLLKDGLIKSSKEKIFIESDVIYKIIEDANPPKIGRCSC